MWESIFQSILLYSKFNMVGTHSSHLVIPLAGALRASASQPLITPAVTPGVTSNQDIVDFMRQVAESMEVLRNQNEDLNTRLTVVEAQSSRRERECEERRENVRRGKRAIALYQQDNESTIEGRLHTVQNEEHHEKSHHVQSPNGESCHERSYREKSPHQGSQRERGHVRSLIIRDLAMRRLRERNLIRKGDTERNLTTENPTTTIAMKRWETSRRSKLSLLGRLLVKI
jgi:hypothetical protein